MWGGNLSETITYEYLWQLFEKEKQTNQLQAIPRTFYKDALVFAEKLKESRSDTNPALRENAIKLLGDLFEKRKQKILIYVAYKRLLPQPTSNTETEFYNKLAEISNSNRLDSVENAHNLNKITLKSLRDIPEVILPSGAKIGPFTKNQIIELKNPEESDVEFLVNNTICERA